MSVATRFSLMVTLAFFASMLFMQPAKAESRASKLDYVGQFEFPSQVNIIVDYGTYNQMCSGTILTRTVILSSNYCAIGIVGGGLRDGSAVNVYAGTPGPELDFFNPYKQVRLATAYLLRDDFHGGSPAPNDIALIFLNRPLVFNKAIQPAKIAPWESLYADNTTHTLTGFNQSMPWSKKIDISILNPSVCKYFFPRTPFNMECAYGGKDARSFAYGAAIYINYGGKKYLSGIEAASATSPVYFAKMISYRNWLRTNIGGSYIP